MDRKKVKRSPEVGGGDGHNLEENTKDLNLSDIAAIKNSFTRLKKKRHKHKMHKPKLSPFEERYSWLYSENKLKPEDKRIDYVLVYPVPKDYSHDAARAQAEEKKTVKREKFENLILGEGFLIQKTTIKENVFVKLHCSFKRLCYEAEKVKLEMPLKDCRIPEGEPHSILGRFIADHLETDGEVSDFVSTPFRMSKVDRFDKYEDPENFFRPALRSLLVDHILSNIDISESEAKKKEDAGVEPSVGGCLESILCCGDSKPGMPKDLQNKNVCTKRGLPYLLMKNVYTEAFILHDESLHRKSKMENIPPQSGNMFTETDAYNQNITDARKELNDKWTRPLAYQPMWHIRNYFGEKIAFYFAWTGMLVTTLWIPMFFGFAVFLYGLHKSITDTSAARNGTGSAELQNVLEDIKRAFDNDVTPFYSLFICCWGTIFLEVWKRQSARLAYEWDVDMYEANEPDRPQFKGTRFKKNPITSEIDWYYPFGMRALKFATSGMVFIVMVIVVIASVISVIIYRVIISIDYCPTMSNQACFVLTTIVSSVLNAVSIIILGLIYDKLAVMFTDWENHRTQTDYNDSLILKVFTFKLVNSYASCFYIAFFRGQTGRSLLESRYVDSCEGSCMTQLSFQVMTLMLTRPLSKFVSDVGIPIAKNIVKKMKIIKLCKSMLCCRKNQVKIENEEENTPQAIFLFNEWSKPSLGDFTLGEYTEKVILYGYLMLFACSFPLAPMIALIVCMIDIRVDAKRLLWLFRRPVALISADIGMWYNILTFLNLLGVLSNAFIIAFTSNWGSQFSMMGKLWVIIGFEHIVLALKFFLAFIIPDVPQDVTLAMRREKYLIHKKLEKEIDVKITTGFNELFPDSEKKLSSEPSKVTSKGTLLAAGNGTNPAPNYRMNFLSPEHNVDTGDSFGPSPDISTQTFCIKFKQT
ncbi:anoctamin-7-like isoform X2 [Physella acuta]|uniref:anoctamin-7-like isoform X2 n=1 Tax=Physella acuta TaxID=109671 RepID=UPI0027DD539E|nr:anoctamin-7-like isoform X2 [Physella acuta]